MPSHQLQLWQLGRRYESLEHPSSSSTLQVWRAVGILDGAGNHCDFIAGEQRLSQLPSPEIQAFYADQAVNLYLPTIERTEDNYAVDYIRFETPGGWPPGSYAVYLYDGPNDSAGDWRCN